MNRNLLRPSILSLTLVFGVVSAQETFFGTLDSDVAFSNGVLLQGVTASKEGVAAIDLEGTGSLTVSSAAGGGFPRVIVYGGTTITSTRTFSAEETNKTEWGGQFDAPGSTVKPGFFDITDPGAGFADDYEAVDAFSMGLSNEEFKFSPAADFVFPVGEQNGQKLYLATEEDDLTWKVDTAVFCIVQDSLCALPLGLINKVALIKEKFDSCPVTNITNGTVGPTPNCIKQCNSGFQLNDAATGCEAIVSNDEFETGFEESTAETTTSNEQALYENQIVAPVKEYEFPPGHFRYRASGEKFYRYLPTDGLTGDIYVDPVERNTFNLETEAGQARVNNMGYLSRNPRSAEEQLASNMSGSQADAEANEESFITYLIQMRNHFGANAQENHYTAMSAESGSSAEGGAEGGQATTGEMTESDDAGGTFLSSGPMLPSTGPGLFVTIAVVGFALMMFGARRS